MTDTDQKPRSGISSSWANKKRKFHDNKSGSSGHRHGFRNPKRGGPGVLLTCETGRESKCRREGLQILNYYHSIDEAESKEVVEEDNKKPLSLEDELKMLKSQKDSDAHESSRFSVFETGCRGTVFLLCTDPGCNLIPSVKIEKESSSLKCGKVEHGDAVKDDKEENDDDNDDSAPEAKKIRKDDDCGTEEPDTVKTQTKDSSNAPDAIPSNEDTSSPWDPVVTVRQVFSDLQKNSTDPPSSRFVTRMIPIQATCFASVEELQATSKVLLDKFLPKTAKTFAITAKRRNCSNLNRDNIINTIATLVSERIPNAKVNLNNPDVTVVVEVCKTLCGISVVPECVGFGNFNLLVAKEEAKE